MKILHVISQRPEHTGSGVYVKAVLQEARRVGYESFLVAGVPADGYPQLETVAESNRRFVEFEGRDLPFSVVGMSDTMPYRSHRFAHLTVSELEQYRNAFKRALIEAVDLFHPNVIHCHHLWIVTSLARNLFPQIPVVASCHGTALRQKLLCTHLAGEAVEGCQLLDGVMALGKIQAEMIAEQYRIPRERIRIVGGGYNHQLFYPEARTEVSEVQLLYAGKLSASKGVPLLLKALSRIRSLPWKMHLAGSSSGPEYEYCQELAKLLEGKVCFHGLVDQKTLADLMRKSHLFVLPSFYEGLPLVLLEALASGCRIVSTSLPGTREIFANMTSDHISLIPLPELETVDQPYPEDEAGLEDQLATVLKKQIQSALEAPNICLAPFENILKHYTWAEVFSRIDTVYRNIPLR